MSEKNRFDDLMKRKLEQLDAPMPENAWQLFSDRQDAALDEALKEKLNEVKVPYQESTWQRIRLTLDAKRRRPFFYLLTAAAALLLLLIVGQGIYFSQHKAKDTSLNSSVADTTSGVDNNVASKLEQQTTVPSIEKGDNEISSSSLASTTAPSLETKKPFVKPTSKSSREIEFLQTEISNQMATPSSNTVISTPDLNKIYNSFDAIFDNQKNVLEQQLYDEGIVEEGVDFGPVESIENKPISLLVSNFRLISDAELSSGNSPWRAGVFLSGDYNTVLTPRIEDLSSQPFVNHGIGYSGGFSLSFNKPQWFMEAGLQVSSNQYEPKPLTEVAGDLEAGYRINSLKRVELNIVRMPVNFMYKFVKSNKFDVYSVTGVTLNVAFTANYFRQTRYIGADPTLRTFEASSNSVIESVPYSNGWLEGGAFSQNRFISVNAGVGMQYQLNNRFSLYTQPVFQYGFSKGGIGPFADRYHSVSVLMGTKISLGKE